MSKDEHRILVNCDMGESFGAWQMGADDSIMPLIDMANIACGFHAGDPNVMQRTVVSALEYNVRIGAHPSYPDLQGFGRRSMRMTKGEIRSLLCYQVGALEGIVRACGADLNHVKPHGALYNDMMQDPAILLEVIQAVSDYNEDLMLVVQATERWQEQQQLAEQYGVSLCFEAFSDRAYRSNGFLVPRSQPDAVLAESESLVQCQQIMQNGTVTSIEGQALNLKIDTLCIHGDGPGAVSIAQHIKKRVSPDV